MTTFYIGADIQMGGNRFRGAGAVMAVNHSIQFKASEGPELGRVPGDIAKRGVAYLPEGFLQADCMGAKRLPSERSWTAP